MTDLLPCPFCGGMPTFYPAQILINGDCPESIDCDNDDCPVCPSTGYLPFDDAIAAWNRLALPVDASPAQAAGVDGSTGAATGGKEG